MLVISILTIRVIEVVNMIVLCFVASEAVRQFSWKADQSFDNKVCPHGVNSYGKYSESACAVMCSFSSTCNGFSYRKQDKVCRMCTKSAYLYSSSEVLVGAKTYPLPCSMFEGSCYYLVTTPLDSSKARAHCELLALDGHLIYIETLAEKEFVVNMLNAHYQSGVAPRKVWLGGHDLDTNVFRWFDGNHVGYTGFSDWRIWEPSNASKENCLAAASSYNYAWTDDKCSKSYPSVCEVTY